MSNDLFFIAIIEAAMAGADRGTALLEGFARIRRMGQERLYRRGYRQFLHWMQTAALAHPWIQATRERGPALEVLDRSPGIGLFVERDEIRIAGLPLGPREAVTLLGIAPGSYRFRIDTGCVLWEGSISEHGEFIGHAKAGEPLRMVAATPGPAAASRGEIRLMDGVLLLRLSLDGQGLSLEIDATGQEA